VRGRAERGRGGGKPKLGHAKMPLGEKGVPPSRRKRSYFKLLSSMGGGGRIAGYSGVKDSDWADNIGRARSRVRAHWREHWQLRARMRKRLARPRLPSRWLNLKGWRRHRRAGCEGKWGLAGAGAGAGSRGRPPRQSRQLLLSRRIRPIRSSRAAVPGTAVPESPPRASSGSDCGLRRWERKW
jgi:hypothetical protein